jgi:hypothetical protein
MPKQPNTQAAQTVARWQAQPDRGPTAVLGARMLAGEWVGSADAIALGSSGTVANQVRTTLKAAGYKLESQSAGPAGRKAYRVKPGGPAKQQRRPVATEAEGTTYPALGAHLTVRALALDEGGNLVVHLSNGTGAAWAARLTGHVEQ